MGLWVIGSGLTGGWCSGCGLFELVIVLGFLVCWASCGVGIISFLWFGFRGIVIW